MIDKKLDHIFETPNAVMRTLAAPSLGSSDLAVWSVEMRSGQTGPLHTAEHEQVWVILEGRLTVNDAAYASGETVVIAAGAARQISAPGPVRALVASRAGGTVTTAEGTRPLPWAC